TRFSRDWSSDVCSSDLAHHGDEQGLAEHGGLVGLHFSSILRRRHGFRLIDCACRKCQRWSRYGPHAGSRTSPSARTRRWRTRPSGETAYRTPLRPSRAAYSSMLALGAKLGDSSSEPGERVVQRGVPRLRSMTASRWGLPAPWATASFCPPQGTSGWAL